LGQFERRADTGKKCDYQSFFHRKLLSGRNFAYRSSAIGKLSEAQFHFLAPHHHVFRVTRLTSVRIEFADWVFVSK
jgi:hypothetical protein